MYQPLAGILGYAVDLRRDILAGRSQRSHDSLLQAQAAESFSVFSEGRPQG